MKPDTLGVIGLGALGGSIAWQAARSGVPRILGHTSAPKDGVAALKAGAVTELATSITRLVELSDLVVIALPPGETIELLEVAASSIVDRPVYCTDVATVKDPVTARATELRLDRNFAGSHPLVDSCGSGFVAARPDLVSGQIVYVTPLADGDVPAAEVADFWERVIGAQPVLVDSRTHDSTLAWTSHMPQLLASVLAADLAKRGPKGVTYGYSALTTTKCAVAQVDALTETLLLNRAEVLAALDAVIADAGRLMVDLEAGSAKRLREWLESGCRWRESVE